MVNSFANTRIEGSMSCGIPSTEHVHYGYRARILLYPYYKSEILKSVCQVACDASFGAIWIAKQGGSCTINEICDRCRKIEGLKREKP